jgi:Cu/Ag efflux pump CusA
VKEHLGLGAVLASLVVLLFLGSLRSTFIAAIAIPTSIVGTFMCMWWMGFTLNTITLLALALAVGIVIDDAIVVLENIFRYIEEKRFADAGRDLRHQGDRPAGARDDAVAAGGVPARRVHAVHPGAVPAQLRPHHGRRDR